MTAGKYWFIPADGSKPEPCGEHVCVNCKTPEESAVIEAADNHIRDDGSCRSSVDLQRALAALRAATAPRPRYSLIIPSNMVRDAKTGRELNASEVLGILNAYDAAK